MRAPFAGSRQPGAGSRDGDLRLSVIVPVHDGAAVLPRCLAALSASDLPRAAWELVVVDDASRDGSAELAARAGARVLRVADGPRGPAHARNLGAEAARAPLLAFVDADVCVHADTLRRLAEALEAEPALAAVFGAYDTAPAAPGLVSQYRNLLHHYVHAENAGEAATFWAGCGAVRAEAFRQVGGFDAARYPRPQIEDVELGYRLRERGLRIRLAPEIQATHLKRWTLGGMVATDVAQRGVPWARLLLERGARAGGTLNTRAAERWLTAATGVGWAALAAGLLLRRPLAFVAAGGAGAAVLAGNARLLRWFARRRGVGFAAAVVPLRVLYYTLNLVSVAGALALHRAARARRRADAPPPPTPTPMPDERCRAR